MIADSIELVARGNHFDGLVCLSGCDKTNPGVVMALARLDIPGVALYGGIAPGHLGDKDLTIQDVFEAVGAYASKRIDAEQFSPWRMPHARERARAADSLPPTRCPP